MSERDEFEAAWNEWKANEDAHGGFVSFKDFTAGYRAARAPQGVPALTDEQIAAQDARYAIDGAIAYGRMGTNQPPAGHWLTEYWAIGQQLAKLGETSIWDNQTPADKTVKFARYDAMEEAGRQASEEMRRLERYLEETSAPQPSPEPKGPK